MDEVPLILLEGRTESAEVVANQTEAMVGLGSRLTAFANDSLILSTL